MLPLKIPHVTPKTKCGQISKYLKIYIYLMHSADSLEKTLMLGKIEGKRREWQTMRWLDSIMDSIDII